MKSSNVKQPTCSKPSGVETGNDSIQQSKKEKGQPTGAALSNLPENYMPPSTSGSG